MVRIEAWWNSYHVDGGLWRCPKAMITRRWKEEERENFGRRVLASGVGEVQLCKLDAERQQ
jgi:hypothetical protein